MKMKILIAVSLILAGMLSIDAKAQESGPRDPMTEGTWLLNFGIGPGIRYYSGYNAGFGPGLQVAFERGMWQLGPGVLTLGAEVGLSIFSYKNIYYLNDTYKFRWVSLIPAARSAYHYGWRVKGLDTYGGLSTGFRLLFFSAKYNGVHQDQVIRTYNPGSFYFFFGTFVGASYFFNDKIGVNGELGYNTNYAQIGMIFKLN
jgi:hypothetical protein